MSVISKGSTAWLSASPCTTFPSTALQGCQMCHLAPRCPGNWLQASKDLAESMKMLAASKRKCPNCRAGDKTAENQKTVCSPVCSSLWDNCSSKECCHTGCKTDLWYNYKSKLEISKHTTRLSKGPHGGLQIIIIKKKDLSSVSMVTEQSRVTRSFSLISQDCLFKKIKK